jgi:hypothetical protein
MKPELTGEKTSSNMVFLSLLLTMHTLSVEVSLFARSYHNSNEEGRRNLRVSIESFQNPEREMDVK